MAFDWLTRDELLMTIVPIVAYWIYGSVYHFLPLNGLRLHSPKEEDTRNLVTKATVIKGVIFQQTLQAIASILVAKSEENKGKATTQTPVFIQAAQFVVAMVVMDTWQYFMHRLMHVNSFLYRKIHSQHHKLLVPYAFGALYNHPLEGLLVDTFGGVISYFVSGMSPRLAMYFFTLAMMKAVDDHCGVIWPGNPLDIMFSNTAEFHDVHHQLYGNKYNFSQPFFVVWDKLLGTYMPVAKRSKC